MIAGVDVEFLSKSSTFRENSLVSGKCGTRNLFVHIPCPTKKQQRDVTVLVEEVFAREKKTRGRTISAPQTCQTQKNKNDETRALGTSRTKF